ncbi:protein kinase [Frateuria sp. GZRe12]|uniref:protein kinase domain-containing protein n=1 Tax=Frateuria sp. GZRe12 TaxID=3351533 RepID=UPI003EDBCA7A
MPTTYSYFGICEDGGRSIFLKIANPQSAVGADLLRNEAAFLTSGMAGAAVDLISYGSQLLLDSDGYQWDIPFIATEYLDYCLVDVVAWNDWELSLKIICGLLSAVDALSIKGIVHGDVSPSNILLASDLKTVKLCDFGSARYANQELCAIFERTGPHQPLDEHYTTAFDFFSFGAIVHLLVAHGDFRRFAYLREPLTFKRYVPPAARAKVAVVLKESAQPDPEKRNAARVIVRDVVEQLAAS